MNEDKYAELVRKLRSQHESFKKWQRKLMNEPESEAKYAQIDLMQKVIDRSREVVNWWDGYEAKIARREKNKLEQERIQKQKQKKEVFRKQVEITLAESLNEYVQEWNTTCRYYSQSGQDRSCSCGMDMTYCGKTCAFASNVVGSSRVYDAPIRINGKRVR